MKKKFIFQFSPRKWGICLRILRLHFKGKKIQNKIDVIVLLDFGFGQTVNLFSKGIWFYLALSEFGVKEDWKARFGFTLPIKSGLK